MLGEVGALLHSTTAGGIGVEKGLFFTIKNRNWTYVFMILSSWPSCTSVVCCVYLAVVFRLG